MTIRHDSRARSAAHARAAMRNGPELLCLLPAPGTPESLGGLLQRQVERFGNGAMFREQTRHGCRDTSWAEFAARVAAFGTFLEAVGTRTGDRVVAVSPNRSEMLVAEFAAAGLGAIHVPIFAGYSREQTRALVEHASPVVLLLASVSQLERTGLPSSVRAVVSFDEVPARSPHQATPGGDVADFSSLARGPADTGWLHRAAAVDPHLPSLILYTSGTTGLNKGVLLSHDNLLSQQRALSAAVWRITSEDRFLSYLPWHHSFGGNFEKFAALANGALLVIDDSHGRDFDRLLANWKAVRPTVYFSVPKVFQQLVGHVETHPEDEDAIFHPGLRFVFTAAAPLPAHLSAFFAARRIPVQEGWGLTETAPCCTVTDPAEVRAPGVVGYPIPGVTLRLAPDGEILVRGPNVMAGYFGDAKATARALPGDGWFHTGDLGEYVGTALRLLTRKDRVFKLLNAEKVVPTTLEQILASRNPYIRHVIVAGEGRASLSALIFPDFFRIEQEFGPDRERAEQTVKQSLRETLLAFNREHLVKYERIEAFAVVSRELSVENQELTPSLKVRFRNVLEASTDYLEAIYQPTADCDCRFLRKVMRLAPDDRPCFMGHERTLDRCHECSGFVFPEESGTSLTGGVR